MEFNEHLMWELLMAGRCSVCYSIMNLTVNRPMLLQLWLVFELRYRRVYRRLELDCHSFYTLAELRDTDSQINKDTETMLLVGRSCEINNWNEPSSPYACGPRNGSAVEKVFAVQMNGFHWT